MITFEGRIMTKREYEEDFWGKALFLDLSAGSIRYVHFVKILAVH